MLTVLWAFVVGWLQMLTVALTFKAAFGLNSQSGGFWHLKLL
jgi:hypothetical protein